MATAESNGTVHLYDAQDFGSNTALYESKDHFFPVNDIAFAESQPWMATCANDTLLNMHDLNKGLIVRSFIGGHQSFVTKCKFN